MGLGGVPFFPAGEKPTHKPSRRCNRIAPRCSPHGEKKVRRARIGAPHRRWALDFYATWRALPGDYRRIVHRDRILSSCREENELGLSVFSALAVRSCWAVRGSTRITPMGVAQPDAMSATQAATTAAPSRPRDVLFSPSTNCFMCCYLTASRVRNSRFESIQWKRYPGRLQCESRNPCIAQYRTPPDPASGAIATATRAVTLPVRRADLVNDAFAVAQIKPPETAA